ncbi:MAG: plasmid pRiA4b ORF-3 family protein [Saprospiraceae bacterium]|nr:plasmid pRiA4b ORF-3 family protein [Saprospiraceae bacterium]
MPTLTLQIHLTGTEPLVTRTFKVSSENSMYLLHHIIQVVMGWENYHLYQFEIGDFLFADRRLWDEDEMGPISDVKEVSVGEVFTGEETTLMYEYDFGDGWIHHIELVDQSSKPTQEILPFIISGENACPPEDCGGIYGYKHLMEVMKNPKHADYYETREWLGLTFNPFKYSVDAQNKKLGKLNKYIREYEEGFKR